MRKKEVPGTFFDMLQSFVTLAETLNVSKATEILGTTRQTIKRHISELQLIKGQEFFDRSFHQYKITDDGAAALAEAKLLLLRSSDWLHSKLSFQNAITAESFESGGDFLFVQDHPVVDLWTKAPAALKSGLKCWAEANGEIEHPSMRKVRPYLLVFREREEGWLCMEIGEKSAFASWLGLQSAKSLIGTYLDSTPLVSKSGRQITDAYHYSGFSGGISYEHISARLPHPVNQEMHTVNYQRLIFPCYLPDGSKVVASLVFRTNNVEVNGIESDILPKMDSEREMIDFEL